MNQMGPMKPWIQKSPSPNFRRRSLRSGPCLDLTSDFFQALFSHEMVECNTTVQWGMYVVRYWGMGKYMDDTVRILFSFALWLLWSPPQPSRRQSRLQPPSIADCSQKLSEEQPRLRPRCRSVRSSMRLLCVRETLEGIFFFFRRKP